jgi:hypothetical protein
MRELNKDEAAMVGLVGVFVDRDVRPVAVSWSTRMPTRRS